MIEGRAVIYRRDRSSKWQCRYKLNDNKWRRKSTGQSDVGEAKRAATRIYYEGEYKQANKLPVDQRRFGSVADAASKQLQASLDDGTGKSVYRSYIFAIKNYLKPFFGAHTLDNLTPALLKEFDEWRLKKLGHEPKASTITTHNSAMNRVLDLAEQHGWMTTAVRPVLKNKGEKSQARPAFTYEEFDSLVRTILPTWITQGRTSKSKMMRELLRDYILVLANTGIRHGTEAYNLKWRHIGWHIKDGERYLLLRVDGKTGERSAIARRGTETFLRRLQLRFPEFQSLSFDELLARRIDEYVFRLADGTRTTNLNQPFEVLMRESGLAVGVSSETPRTLYSLRHMYATFMLMDGTAIHDLARQMGTSVQMIEQHYSKITPELVPEKFAGPKRVSRVPKRRDSSLAHVESTQTPTPPTRPRLRLVK
ncbi:MAG TPA: integrase [Ramlibacter sp.]|uniref:tyrosine-type recombinase/integrase n=1 Tax=Ramlibacter sp. TaxID=1917967 RepID=UPI002C2F5BAD|nr:integrase [Ramlibacter sp.]HVZ44585.1 integrase [Ramlibacter sp.]